MKKIVLLVALLFPFLASAEDNASKSVEELAKEFANPNTPLTQLKFKVQHIEFAGDLNGANSQSLTKVLLQPTLPFDLSDNYKLWVRPGINLIVEQPSYQADEMAFDSFSGLGDSSIDVQYGTTTKSGFLWSVGASSSIPTASKDEIGNDLWTVGPGFQVGKITSNSVFGTFINHQWDVAGGNGEQEVNLTTVQVFGVYLPGGGWSVASSPIMNYDHGTNQWTIPISLAAGKTFKFNGRPWKFSVGINYYVEKADDFGPDVMIEFIVAPVVVNQVAQWFQ